MGARGTSCGVLVLAALLLPVAAQADDRPRVVRAFALSRPAPPASAPDRAAGLRRPRWTPAGPVRLGARHALRF